MLREEVYITTATGELKGYLSVGADGLPELFVEHEHASQVGMYVHTGPLHYRPATFPAAWKIDSNPYSPDTGLWAAWCGIEAIICDLAVAQREAEDDAKECERERATENAIAREIEEGRQKP